MVDPIDLSLDDIIKKRNLSGRGKFRNRGRLTARGGRGGRSNVARGGPARLVGGAGSVSRSAARGRAVRGKLGARAGRGGGGGGGGRQFANDSTLRGVRGRRARGTGSALYSDSRQSSALGGASGQARFHTNRLAARSPLKKRQNTAVLARGGVLKSGRRLGGVGALQSRAQRNKRLAALALKSKRKALRLLTRANHQLLLTDVRNQLVAKRRPALVVGARGAVARAALRRSLAATATLSQRRRAALARARPPVHSSAGSLPVYHNQRPVTVPRGAAARGSRGRGRRLLDRSRLPAAAAPFAHVANSFAAPTVVPLAAAAGAAALMRVQIKNEPPMTAQHAQPYDPEHAAMADAMQYIPSSAAKINRSPLNGRIQQEIAAIQARARSQRLASHDHSAGDAVASAHLATVRATAAASGRTLNDRFSHDRFVYS